MKKVFSLTLIFSSLIYSEVNWKREQICPLPDPIFVNNLMKTMSIEEKVGQVIQADLDFIEPSDLRDYPIGSVLNGGNTSPRGKLRASPAEWKSLAQEFYEESKKTGASIPVLWGTDAVHGHSNVFGATIFPHNIGIGAAANPQLVQDIGAAVAEEVLATGLFWTFAPTVTIPQNFRWGRTYEGYSEDPVLVSKLGSAFIEGLQGTEKEFLNDAKILGTAKHFLGDGGTYLGIDQGDTRANEENMRVIHGEPYFASLNSCVRVVMASFNSWNGSKVHGNKYLLTEVLKEKMNFTGFVVGDWNGHQQVPGCNTGSCPESFNAGVDMFMVPENWKALYRNTVKQVKNGEISKERLDDAVKRILTVKQQLGMFEGRVPNQTKYSEVGLQKNRDIARRAVRESLVLIKNNNATLPIKHKQKILVIGDSADSLKIQTGGWTLDWQGANNTNSDFPGSITFLQALKEYENLEITHKNSLSNLDLNKNYDLVIVAYGEEPYAEGIGDRKNLFYRDSKTLNTLKRLKRNGNKVVSIFFTGRPLWTNEFINLSDAFVVAWLPGTESRGMTDVLVANDDGSVNYDFQGKLPFSWPSDPNQSTIAFYDPASDAEFDYGYGLTYKSPKALASLDESFEKTDDYGDLVEIFSGKFNSPFEGFIQENNSPQIKLSSTNNTTQNDVVQIDFIDVDKQDDTLRVIFNADGNLNSFHILTTEVVGLENFKSGFLNFNSRVVESSGAIFLAATCGFGCMGSIDVTSLLVKSKSFDGYSVPLKCLTDKGLDLSKTISPMILFGPADLTIDFKNISISKNPLKKKFSC
ncbi:exo 1,3/1,4-beta-D-glucan glucohydrolase [SAR86 cluster bacterium]|jgi:beta-glucosidase|uniref:Exo 1,3/1,4-beta-D-glucan glucohydrolase n=1 Tax=SAR86 cluster bacterium TaxID=2030880 RepID=A0A9Q8TYW6_9GAMM|nr:exo 1,3/1,4-beta-D-glucan glucohydrolase [SAR86 cluster bacterium]